ncbi:MAG: hypothetical protein IH989_02060 [Planctomycetes bacterium]|nr:hypothetical protein [Planctomycetota bacterium]
MNTDTFFSRVDTYSLKARLWPVLLHFLPLGLAVIAWFPEKFTGWGLLLGIATPCGLTALLTEFGRDQGKKKEPWLFERWGGIPTTQLLRHGDSTIDTHTKARYHKRLGELIPDLKMPSARKEKAAPLATDRVYESCGRFLRARTRDKQQFPLVFKELVSYGLRRNLWGMRPSGVIVAIIGLVLCIGFVVAALPARVPPAAIVASILNLFLLVWWTLRITPEWVRLAGFAYSHAILAACEIIEPAKADGTVGEVR